MKDLNKNNIKAFIEFGIQQYKLSTTLSILFTLWIFWMLCGLLTTFDIFTTQIIFVVSIIGSIACIVYLVKRTIFNQRLFYGIAGINMSLSFLFMAFNLVYKFKTPDLLIFSLFILVYLLNIFFISYREIKKASSGFFLKKENHKSNTNWTLLGLVISYPLFRIFIPQLNQDTIIFIGSFAMFAGSLLMSVMYVQFIKCYLQKKFDIDDTLENYFRKPNTNQ